MRHPPARLSLCLMLASATAACSPSYQLPELLGKGTANQVQILDGPQSPPPAQATFQANVLGSIETTIFDEVNLNTDCSSLGQSELTILQAPNHGLITVDDGSSEVEAQPSRALNACAGQSVPATRLRYGADLHYLGPDSVRLRAVTPSGKSTDVTVLISVVE